MKFTYCLVTKGREEFLPLSLEPLKAVLLNADVEVIIVDNGCSVEVSEMLRGWCVETQAKYLRFDLNSPAAPRIWAALKSFDIDWITFPGDDDVINPEFLISARDIISNDNQLTALAGSMRIIDSVGNRTGQVRNPLNLAGDKVENLARSLHQPPFLFPALFIKFDAITMPLPNSRYIFDWWLSLNLICVGNTSTTKDIAIDYRIHKSQESTIAPSRRKYFEAQVVLWRFIDGHEFEAFLSHLSDNEKRRFWNEIYLSGPIYGDPEFGAALRLKLIVKLVDSMKDHTLAGLLLGEHAASVGTFLRSGEIGAWLNVSDSLVSIHAPNFDLAVAVGSCESIFRFAGTPHKPNSNGPSFLIGCIHSKVACDYLVDCAHCDESPEETLELLIVEITDSLEKNGSLDFKISNTERKLIDGLRRFKTRIPRGLIQGFRNSIERSGK